MIEVNLPDGTVGRFPDGTPDSVIEDVLSKQFPQSKAAPESSGITGAAKQALDYYSGVPEAIAHHISGMVAAPLSDIAGLGAMGIDIARGAKGEVDPTAIKQRVQQALTYDPRSDYGKSPYNPVNALMTGAGEIATLGGLTHSAAEAVRGTEGDPIRAAAADALDYALPQATLFGLAKGLPLAKTGADSVVEKFMGIPERRASNIARSAFGDNPQTLQALQEQAAAGNPGQLTASQAAGPAQTPEFAALQDVVSGQKGIVPGRSHADFYKNLADWQQAQQNKVINMLAGGTSQEASIASQEAAGRALNARLDPMRQTALDNASIAGDTIRDVTPELENAQRALARQSQSPFAPQDKQAFAKAQEHLTEVEDKIGTPAQFGLKPLSATPIRDAIRGMRDRLGDRADPGLVNTLNNLDSRVQRMADMNGGTLNALDLHTFRKTLNDAIESANAGVDTTTKTRISANLNKLKPTIDAAIEDAGGKGWTSYLNKFSYGSNFIKRQKVAQAVQGNPELAAKIGSGNAPDLLEQLTGETSLNKALGSDAHYYRDLAGQYKREGMLSGKAAAGKSALADILNQNLGVSKVLPNFMSPKVTVINDLVKGLQARAGARTLEHLAQGMRTPQGALDLLNRQPLQATSLDWMNTPGIAPSAVLLQQGMMSGADQ